MDRRVHAQNGPIDGNRGSTRPLPYASAQSHDGLGDDRKKVIRQFRILLEIAEKIVSPQFHRVVDESPGIQVPRNMAEPEFQHFHLRHECVHRPGLRDVGRTKLHRAVTIEVSRYGPRRLSLLKPDVDTQKRGHDESSRDVARADYGTWLRVWCSDPK